MIPHRLTLKYFLSYHQACLDFRGLQLACICGPNGAGKSSLLEAMAWAVWGQSRAINEDDVIHTGQPEAQVDFVLEIQGQIYRIIRTRRRRHGTYLEFQAWSEPTAEFRCLTGRSLRQTQALILEHLHLDYKTFINSAYLRQGRADEFMLKRPAERKQLLADLLQLNQYETLAEAAREQARQYKGQLALLSQNWEQIQDQLAPFANLKHQQTTLEQQIQALRQQMATLQCQREQQQGLWQSQQLAQQHLAWQTHQLQQLKVEQTRQQQHLRQTQQQFNQLQPLLQTQSTIQAGYEQFQELQNQDQALAVKATPYQTLESRRQDLQRGLEHSRLHLHQQIQTSQAQFRLLEHQAQDCQKILRKEAEIQIALSHLHQAQQQLRDYEQRQNQAFPLLQRLRHLELEQERQTSRLVARMDELRHHAQELQAQQAGQPQLQQAVLEVSSQVSQLEKQRVYLQHLQDKGLERRRFMEQLQARQRELETQLAQLDQKMHLLTVPGASCPLCEHPLDELHWAVVKKRHEREQQDLFDQIWVIREQLAVSEREIQVLRREYREVEQQLRQFHNILEQRGRLEAQLVTSTGLEQQLQRTLAEIQTLENTVTAHSQQPISSPEWQQLQTQLAEVNYDEKNHALARGEVERWRWAEAKQTEINQARRQLQRLEQQLPALQQTLQQRQTDLDHLLTESTLARELTEIQAQLQALNYSPQAHHHLQAQLREYQPYLLQWQSLQQAKAAVPQLHQQIHHLTAGLASLTAQIATTQAEITALEAALADIPELKQGLEDLAQTQTQLHQDLEAGLAESGRLQQQQQHQTDLQQQANYLKHQQQQCHTQLRIYQELTQAFGQNGIPAMIIENLLPQLEAETNHLLARLTSSQLHVQFVTQKFGRRSKADSKLIDTLDIFIADSQGSRPYETYSGGEAFRVNFAIRLALSRLLARQSGSELQLLVIDEGFGTQDQAGCERLIAALNSIAPDFACILAITHMPKLQAAFHTRIAVNKTTAGSQLQFIS